MTVVSLRPDGTISNSGSVVGAASAHAALSDNSDASYVAIGPGQAAALSLGDPVLPAGAVVKHGALRARLSVGTENQFSWHLDAFISASGAPSTGGRVNAAFSSPTTITVGSVAAGWTGATVNAARLDLTGVPSQDSVVVYEAYFDVTYVAKPVTSVTAPTGTVSNTNQPTVAWSNTLDADGGGQTMYDAKIFSQAQYTAGGFNPATSASVAATGAQGGQAQSWQSPVILADGIYRAYVRVSQTVNGAQHWSDWQFSEFTISVALPAVPSMVLAAQNTAGRNAVTLSSGGGPVSTDRFELEHSLDGGVTWAKVRLSGDEIIGAGGGTMYDYEAPNGTETWYRARALHSYSGVFAASAWVTSSTTWASSQWWLGHPLRPALNVPIELFSYSEIAEAARLAAIQPLGALLPVVMSDTNAGETGTVVVQCRTVAEQEALKAILRTTETLLLRGPAADGHPDRYIRCGGRSSARVIDKSWSHITRETLTWHLVARPSGAQVGAQYVAPADAPEELVVA